MQQALHAEFTLREADGQLTWAVCGIEEGEENQRAHLQLCYCVMACVNGTSASKKRVSGEEKKWMKRASRSRFYEHISEMAAMLEL